MSSTKLFLFLFLFCQTVFSQENFVKHRIAKGESLYAISKKYNVSLTELAKVNPAASGILKLNDIILIPNKKPELEARSTSITHLIKPNETLYGIAKKYKVTVSKIRADNPKQNLDNLKVGTEIVINSKVAVSAAEVIVTEIESDNKAEILHEVVAKETKYGISKKYGVSIETLEKLNPTLVNGLAVGSKLIVKAGVKQDSSAIVTGERSETKSEISQEVTKSPSGEPYAVLIPIYEKADLPDKLVATASEHIGTNYRSGGTTKAGFDCSGLIWYTYGTYDVQLPRTSAEQSQFGTTISKAEAQKGDLIFFSTNGSGSINHVGMITEVNDAEIKFIHSSSSNGVMISSNQESYYAKCFKKIARVLK